METIGLVIRSEGYQFMSLQLVDGDILVEPASDRCPDTAGASVYHLRCSSLGINADRIDHVITDELMEHLMNTIVRLADGYIKSIHNVVSDIDGGRRIIIDYDAEAEESYIRFVIVNATIVSLAYPPTVRGSSSHRFAAYIRVLNTIQYYMATQIAPVAKGVIRRTFTRWR